MSFYLIKGQYAGGDAGKAVRTIVVSLRKILLSLVAIDYSSDIQSIRINLGVSGDIDKFKEPNGCSNYRIMKKYRYASVNLTMHKDVWTEGETTIKYFITDNIKDASEEICLRVEKADLKINKLKLLSDLTEVLKKLN